MRSQDYEKSEGTEHNFDSAREQWKPSYSSLPEPHRYDDRGVRPYHGTSNAAPVASGYVFTGTNYANLPMQQAGHPVFRSQSLWADQNHPIDNNIARNSASLSSIPVSGNQVGSHGLYAQPQPQGWDNKGRYSPTESLDDIITSPNMSDYSLDHSSQATQSGTKRKSQGKGRSQRRPTNRDEFDGPHQFLQRPPPEIIAIQDRELPHLPTNLHVQEQDSLLGQVNDRLSQCAFDFVAKYQFPIPLTQDMRPVERPQDREWTEWVYLLKRLATKRRVPARVLYNGQIKQFVTILENSLEMRHAAKHQSRPLKDDRNILQLISAGIQVAKILKDASAMEYLDHLYISTERQIHERSAARTRHPEWQTTAGPRT